MKALICAVVLVMCQAAAAQEKSAKFTDLIFTCECKDSVGSQYAFQFRDLLAKSPRYAEVADSKETRSENFKVQVVTTADDDHSNASAISVVVTFSGVLLVHFVQVCGSAKVQACAVDALSMIDSDLHSSR